MMARLLGRMLRGLHAGEKHLLWNEPEVGAAPASLVVTSPAFEHGALIPPRHAGKRCGDNIAPALAWTGVPSHAAELVLVLEDPSAPLPRPFAHAIVIGIAPGTSTLEEGWPAVLERPRGATGPRPGRNTRGGLEYRGPGPVPGHGPHAYVFQLFALDRPLAFDAPPSRAEIQRAVGGSVIARGRLDGFYER